MTKRTLSEEEKTVRNRESKRKSAVLNKEKKNESTRKWRVTNPEKNREASRKSAREWAAAHPEKANETKRKWKIDNREKNLKSNRESARKMYSTDPEKFRERTRLRQNERKVVLAGRNRPDVCDVCHTPSNRTLHFDHDHNREDELNGGFRGWLCHGCNSALGWIKDSPATLRALADYLEQSVSSV